MAGTLRLSNTGTGNGQSTITAAASGDTVYTLPSGGGTFVTTSSTQALTVPFASGTASAPSVTFLGDSNTGIYSPGADQVAVATNGTGRLFIDASGNVGVGTSSVNALLEVNNSTAGGEVQRIEGNYDGSGSVILTNWRRAGGSVAAALKYNDDSSPLCMSIGTTTSHEFRIRTADTDAITIDASQRVGIGTSSPQASARLHVYATGDYIDESAPFTVGDSTAGGMRLFFGINNTSNYGYIGSVESATAYRSLVLQPGGGNVGIGTTSPSQLLHISGSGGAYARIDGGSTSTVGLLFNNGDGAIYYDNNTDYLRFDTLGGEKMRLDSSGRLGIGTSTPGSYNAYADDLVIANGSGNPGITLAGSATGWGSIYFADGTTGSEPYSGYIQYSHTNDRMTFATGGGLAAMHIDSSQRVGIGTTSPAGILDIDVTGDQLVRFQTTAAMKTRLVTGNSDVSAIEFSDQAAYRAKIQVETSDAISFYTGGITTEAARLDSSGRLLVGTSTNIGSQNIQIGTATGTLGLYKFANNDDGGELTFATSRNGTVGSQTIVNNGDFLGRMFFRGSDGSAFIRGAEIACRVDSTPGANDMPARLVFSTTADGASVPIERLRLSSNGFVSAPGVYSNTTAGATNVNVDANGLLRRSTSSAKYKTDIETLQDSYADALLGCRPVWYRSTCENDNSSWGWWGFIAEEVAAIDPRLVQWKTFEVTYDENGSAVSTPCDPEPEGVSYDRFVPHLLNLIKRQQQAIEDLQVEVAALKAQ
jgi:hypothetical protein